MDRIALQILEDGWEHDARVMRRAVAANLELNGDLYPGVAAPRVGGQPVGGGGLRDQPDLQHPRKGF